ncbi:unnamed protein product, partial [Darwinula stevensoni]
MTIVHSSHEFAPEKCDCQADLDSEKEEWQTRLRPEEGVGMAGEELSLRLGLTFCFIATSSALPISNSGLIGGSAQRYLVQFGYLPESDVEVGNLRTEDELVNALKHLQRYAGIPATGEMDAATRKLLKKPRCGLPDPIPVESGRRNKRYTLQGAKWDHTNLTWRVDKWTTHLGKHEVRTELEHAFELWSSASRLTFTEIRHHSSDNDADILVSFHRGYHEDGYPFDGEGTVLAHAFFPGSGRGGDAHFDDEEKWASHPTVGGKGGVSLFAVAAHEFGHSLGLSHSSVESALMFPWYKGLEYSYTLPKDDTYGIEQLYGAKDGTRWAPLPPNPATSSPSIPVPPTTSPPTPRTTPVNPPPKPVDVKPDSCDTAYDAISVIRGELFIFRGKYFWRVGKDGLVQGEAIEITRFWYGLPNDLTHVDALYERPHDMKIVFFIDAEYYVFEGNQKENGYPRPLTDLGLPSDLSHIDGAMVWGHNGKTYFFSSTMYWRCYHETGGVSDRKHTGQPHSVHMAKLVKNVKAWIRFRPVIKMDTLHTTMRFDEEHGKVELDYPRDMSMWRGIPYNIDAVTQWSDGESYAKFLLFGS